MTSERQSPGAREGRVRSALRSAGRIRTHVPWIIILLLTSGFQFFRGAPADGAVFLLAGIAIVFDAFGRLRIVHSSRRPHRVVAVSVGVILVALLTLLPRYSVADGVIVAGIGISLIPFAWPDPHRGQVTHAEPTQAEPTQAGSQQTGPAQAADHAIRRAAIAWSSLGIALCLWEVVAFFFGLPSPTAEYAHPPLSDLIGPLLGDPIGRAVCVALWLLGGAALLRRGHTQ